MTVKKTFSECASTQPRIRFLVSAMVTLCCLGSAVVGEEWVPAWEMTALDAAFRSEGVAAGDVNHDGLQDVMAGDVWYEAPDWKMHAIRKVGKFVAGKGYSDSFANFAYDVNGDGWVDMVYVSFPGNPFSWYENPKNEKGHWKEHKIWTSICNESPEFEDLDGDGKPEVIFGSQPESKLGFVSIPAKEKTTEMWPFQAISRAGDPMKNGTFKYYHGLGVGDLNQDGRADVLIPHGWWKGPESFSENAWEFTPYELKAEGEKDPVKAANMYVHDLDLDGDQDILASCAHAYGVWWFENLSGNDGREFKMHLIDDSYSQTHAAEFVDMNGDGQKDLVTGKRFFAHNGGDPGGHDPVGMYWYEIKRQKGKAPQFIRHEIEEGRGTGVGTQFLIHHMNDDNRPDIVLSNKKGVHLIIQK